MIQHLFIYPHLYTAPLKCYARRGNSTGSPSLLQINKIKKEKELIRRRSEARRGMCSLFTQVPVDCYTVRLLPDDARVKPRERGIKEPGEPVEAPSHLLSGSSISSISLSAAESSRETAADVTVLLSRITLCCACH